MFNEYGEHDNPIIACVLALVAFMVLVISLSDLAFFVSAFVLGFLGVLILA